MVSPFVAQILASFFGRRSERRRSRPSCDRSLPAYVQQLDPRQLLSGASVAVASMPTTPSDSPVIHATVKSPSVTSAPQVTINPTSQTLKAGQTAVFNAAATGNPAPKAQWQVSTNGGVSYANLAGQINTTLNVLVTAAMNNYRYREVFTNTLGTATTLSATLTVAVAPQLTKNPVSQSVVSGTVVTFTASASGSPAPGIQWVVSTNGGSTYASIPGATSSTLTFAASAAQNGYYYRAILTNSVGTVTTAAAKLTIVAPPVTASMFKDFGDGLITPAAVVTSVGAIVGRSLFWVTSQSTGDVQLWSTTGTSGTTILVHDFGKFTASKAVIGAANGYLFIGLGGSQTQNAQVWRTNGTVAGTAMIENYVNSFLTVLNPVNGVGLYGVVDTATHVVTIYGVNSNGVQLVPTQIGTAGNVGVTTFASASPILGLGNVNGTANGTALISITVYNGTVGPTSVQLWGTDGIHGTTLLRNFNTGSTSLSNVGTVNGVALIGLFSSGDNQLWQTNGTATGTVLLTHFANGVIKSLGTSGVGFALLGVSFYTSPNGILTDTQLWSSNGTVSGTTRVRSYGLVTLTPLGIVYGAVEFYLTNAATSDNQIWYSYGQTSTTDLVQDFPNSTFIPMSTVNGVVTLGIHTNGVSPTQSLWGISGRPGNLALIANLAGNSTLSYVATVNGVTMFTVTKPFGIYTTSQLWRTDGTTANTVLIQDFGEYSSFVYEGYVNGVALIGVFDSVTIDGQLYAVRGL